MIHDPGKPVFPPLFSGIAAPSGVPPFDYAGEMARAECDGGTVVYDLTRGDLAAAVVFAPDVPLRDAVAMLPLCGVGLANALGALSPPEVAVHLDWDGGIRVNGAACGALGIAASDAAPDAVPDWLVVDLAVRFLPETDDAGTYPDRTALYAEGCGEVTPLALLEAWIRHSMVWLNRWTDDGGRALHREWEALTHAPGEEIDHPGWRGTYVGADERFSLLVRTGDETRSVPLTTLLRRDV